VLHAAQSAESRGNQSHLMRIAHERFTSSEVANFCGSETLCDQLDPIRMMPG